MKRLIKIPSFIATLGIPLMTTTPTAGVRAQIDDGGLRR